MIARMLALRLLDRGRGGEIELLEPDGASVVVGRLDASRPLRACVQIHSWEAYRQFLRGSRGLGHAYAEGMWDSEDLVDLIRIAARDAHRFDKVRGRFAFALRPWQRALGPLRRNTPKRSRRQISEHYDLGNDFFALFLDETLMYSCAIFPSPHVSLAEASRAKLDHVCAKLALTPADHLLEIGTGWGSLAIHAAGRYGCRVTTTTISAEQYAYARARVREAGLQDRVTVLMRDYRELEGRYDKLVSIEMIEAVGWQHFNRFFATCSRLLTDDGLMLLQAITIDDRAYQAEKATRSFIRTYIFPGGCLPSPSVIGRCVARRTDMRPVHMEDITVHYGETLRRWRERFEAAEERLEQLGYDERFRRLWMLYLAYTEAGFRERRIQDVQLLLAKPRFADEPAAGAQKDWVQEADAAAA